ncbi:glycosyltransferase [Microbacterium sp. CFH 31415]|uniref:glycosyltransferase n=1 Tax=Microbacterium sp. CFH 31415 TaxID=2921732 RepID=UPI001F13485F|nr:glycosyltransferase [Microbacterium sp. CFH 31415]MCH6231713.1 glycosyltransferase [Microbacterium sp. CFH 31415]
MTEHPDARRPEMTGHPVREGVALVATVWNEEPTIHAFLEGLRRQTVHPQEIVVVDGGSTDRTVAELQAWRPPCGCRVRVVLEPGAGIAAGRNAAIAATQMPRLAVTDAGTELRADWLEQLTEPLSRTDPPDVVSGFFEPAGRTFAERAIAATITPTVDEIRPESFMPSSRSVLFSRDAWMGVGGYPEWLDYCEDLVFDFALRDSGARFEFQPKAIAGWIGRPNLRAFAKQYFRYARGDGKAGLFPRRHAARYVAYSYALASVLFITKLPALFLIGCGGLALYMIRPEQRVLARRARFTRSELIRAILLAPVIVITGDLAKMAGYPPGRVWRRKRSGRPTA